MVTSSLGSSLLVSILENEEDPGDEVGFPPHSQVVLFGDVCEQWLLGKWCNHNIVVSRYSLSNV